MLPPQCCRCHKADMFYLTAAIDILLLLPTTTSQAQILKPETHVLGPFNLIDTNLLDVIPSATINLGALQVTPDSTSVVSLFNKSGRVFLKKPFTLWNDEEKIVSFNTSFLINVFCVNNGTPRRGPRFRYRSFSFHPSQQFRRLPRTSV